MQTLRLTCIMLNRQRENKNLGNQEITGAKDTKEDSKRTHIKQVQKNSRSNSK